MATCGMDDLSEILTNIRGAPLISYIAWTIIVWITIAIHFAFIYATPTSLVLNWLFASAVIAFASFVSYGLYRTGSRACSGDRAVAFGLTLITYCWATSFTGIYLGGELQDYWHYNNIPTYRNVDVTKLANIGYEGRFYFTPSMGIVPRLGGVQYYSKGNQPHWVCVLPVLPVNGSGEYVPPSTAVSALPFDVRFWVRVEDRCCQRSFFECAEKNGWNNKYQYGVTLLDDIDKQGDALTDACARWPKDNPSAITSTHPVFIEWTSYDDFENEQSDRVLLVKWMTILTLVLWPLWCIGIAVGVVLIICRGCLQGDCNGCLSTTHPGGRCDCNCFASDWCRRRSQQQSWAAEQSESRQRAQQYQDDNL